MAANSSVPVSIACLHPTLLSSNFAATLALSPPVHSFLLQFNISITQFLLSSADFYLLFIISISSQFFYMLALFCSCKLLIPVLFLLYTRWAPPRGDFHSRVCVHPNIKSHMRPPRNLFCTQKGWSLCTGFNFCCLSVLFSEKEEKVKGVRARPQFKIALSPAEALWGSATELPSPL